MLKTEFFIFSIVTSIIIDKFGVDEKGISFIKNRNKHTAFIV